MGRPAAFRQSVRRARSLHSASTGFCLDSEWPLSQKDRAASLKHCAPRGETNRRRCAKSNARSRRFASVGARPAVADQDLEADGRNARRRRGVSLLDAEKRMQDLQTAVNELQPGRADHAASSRNAAARPTIVLGSALSAAWCDADFERA